MAAPIKFAVTIHREGFPVERQQFLKLAVLLSLIPSAVTDASGYSGSNSYKRISATVEVQAEADERVLEPQKPVERDFAVNQSHFYMHVPGGLMILAAIVLALSASLAFSHPQSCNPAVVSYIIRDEKGNRFAAADLKSLQEQLPASIGDAEISAGEVSFADDEKTYYWPESTDWPKGRKLPSLDFINNSTCTMHLTEVMLVYRGKRMQLIFNIDIARSQSDRRPVIDSLPFQEGVFELDLNGWSRERDKMIPAERWKKVKGKWPASFEKKSG